MSVGTLVERTSDYVMLVKSGATATLAMEGFSPAPYDVPLAMRESMKYHKAWEMAKTCRFNVRRCWLPSLATERASGKCVDSKYPIEVMGEVMQKAMTMRHGAPASIQ